MSQTPPQLPAETTPPPNYYPPRRGSDWGFVLVIACAAIGFCMSWGRYELDHRLTQQRDLERYRHDLDEIIARQSDLGHLLADPRTHLVRLTSAGTHLPAITATVAWNNENQKGAVFSDDLAAQAPQKFDVMLISSAGQESIPFGPTEPGKTVYPLTPLPGVTVQPPSEIELQALVGDDPASASPVADGKVAD